jgi:hypothetical protein
MTEQVVVYRLIHKFVDRAPVTDDGPRQVLYRSLATGHHIGVMDCFETLMEMPLEVFEQWLARLPEGAARDKLAGVLRWGEIELNRSHAGDLLSVLVPVQPGLDGAAANWNGTLIEGLREILAEPALYWVLRRTWRGG